MKIAKTPLLISILILISKAHTITWPVAHQDSAHATNKTYGDWNGYTVDVNSCLGFHGGIDIPSDSGLPIYAVIDGVVSYFRLGTNSDSGVINIAIDTTTSLAWSYQHVFYNTALSIGDSVYIGDSLGCVSAFYFDPAHTSRNDHLHFQRSNNGYTELTGYCNPLKDLIPLPSQVPYVLPRSGVPLALPLKLDRS
jgi:murein DD-endopeptidase MepM/ murein hydrolase activator NlpD